MSVYFTYIFDYISLNILCYVLCYDKTIELQSSVIMTEYYIL